MKSRSFKSINYDPVGLATVYDAIFSVSKLGYKLPVHFPAMAQTLGAPFYLGDSAPMPQLLPDELFPPQLLVKKLLQNFFAINIGVNG
jgi:hypothetical protein